MLKKLAAKAKQLQPILQVGKNGLSDAFLTEFTLLLKKKGLIKVRFLRSFVEANGVKEAAATVAEKSEATLVDVVGNVAVFHTYLKQ